MPNLPFFKTHRNITKLYANNHCKLNPDICGISKGTGKNYTVCVMCGLNNVNN